ncbi:MAG: N-acetyltransferase family protein [Halodesulfurarchaeum sp.]
MARPYGDGDADSLWDLKRGFELGLGKGTGEDSKAARYAEKLDATYREGYLDWVDRCMAEEPRAILLAERKGSAVGYVFVLPEAFAYVWDGAVLSELYVVPEWRGEGVGDELLSAAIEVVTEQDLPLDRVLLDVDRSNDRARAFYATHGFEHWGEMLARELTVDGQ